MRESVSQKLDAHREVVEVQRKKFLARQATLWKGKEEEEEEENELESSSNKVSFHRSGGKVVRPSVATFAGTLTLLE